jgi:hypothetical protein
MEVFKKEVEALTKGDIQIDNFPAMQLGGAQENVDQVRSGTIFAVFTSIAYFTRTVPSSRPSACPSCSPPGNRPSGSWTARSARSSTSASSTKAS